MELTQKHSSTPAENPSFYGTAAPFSLSGRLTVVEIQQSAEPLRLHDRPFPCLQPSVGKRNDIVDSLMIAFGVVVRQVFPNHMTQGVLSRFFYIFLTMLSWPGWLD